MKEINETMIRTFLVQKILLATVLLAVLTLPLAAATFYVSPEGNDMWSGTAPERGAGSVGPFATLEMAQTAIRSIPSSTSPVRVYVREGTYELSRPLVFTPEDSGSSRSPIEFRAYRDEVPVISGGRQITGWQPLGDDLWVTHLPEVQAGDWYFKQLWVDGERRYRARTPNEGYHQIDRIVDPLTKGLFSRMSRFGYEAGAFNPEWRNREDIEVALFFRWIDYRLPLKHIDGETNIVSFTRETLMMMEKGNKYFIENVFEAMDSPGEWYLERSTGDFYYQAAPGEDPNMMQVVAPRLDFVLRLDGNDRNMVEWISFSGLTFAFTEWMSPQNYWTPEEKFVGDYQASSSFPGAVVINRSSNILIENSTIRNVGAYGLEIGDRSRNIRIYRNHIHDTGAGGIYIGRAEGLKENWTPEDVTREIDVESNRLNDLGNVYPSGPGILLTIASHCRIRHNKIHDLTYTGVSVGWSWEYGENPFGTNNLIESNHIHDIGGGPLFDMGGIYTLGESPGTVIRGNLIHDVWAPGTTFGIYLDQASSYITVEKNAVFRTQDAFFLHFGRDNVIKNNLFSFSSRSQLRLGTKEDHVGVALENNIVIWDSGALLGGRWDGSNFTSDRNLFHHSGGNEAVFAGSSFEEWKAQGHDRNSLVTDPLVRWVNGIPHVAESSPAIAIGFEPVDWSIAGVEQSQVPDSERRRTSQRRGRPLSD